REREGMGIWRAWDPRLPPRPTGPARTPGRRCRCSCRPARSAARPTARLPGPLPLGCLRDPPRAIARRRGMFRAWQAFLVIAFALCGVALWVWGGSPSPGNKAGPKNTAAPRTDWYRDPLPEGALAWLGTVRFRHNRIYTVAWSPDGKTLASGSM